MKRRTGASVIAAVIGLVGAVLAPAAQKPKAASTQPGLMVTAAALIGQQVLTSEGAAAGTVSEILIGAKSGRVDYVAVDLGDRTVALPWDGVTLDASGAVRLAVSRTELARAPTLQLGELERAARDRR